MKLLHGSNVIIDQPLLSMCQSNNDFGRGFYLTDKWQRAWAMGRHRVSLCGGEIHVNAFLYYPSRCKEKGLKIKDFKGFSVEWAKFILENRNDETFTHEYDIVIGPVADAFIYKEIAEYKREFGMAYLEDENLRVFISRVNQYGDDYTQFCFCTQKAIDELIKLN